MNVEIARAQPAVTCLWLQKICNREVPSGAALDVASHTSSKWASRLFAGRCHKATYAGLDQSVPLQLWPQGQVHLSLTAGTVFPGLREGCRESFNEAVPNLQGLQRRITWPRGNGSIPPAAPVHVSKSWEPRVKQPRRTHAGSLWGDHTIGTTFPWRTPSQVMALCSIPLYRAPGYSPLIHFLV